MEALQEFVQKLAAFRKAHPVIRKAEPMHLNDYQHKGLSGSVLSFRQCLGSRTPGRKRGHLV